ncbi:GNAT family N-acetyltransferase [Falsarthrobacter nasiphocae]|uniref:GNAT family acetyltransferase n=1 Tax=Falsarthrobacter nasiphocae TaxID=189863 RepID=A0AAE4C6X6_9MICC|nr:GNAT family N-acetyltransferase [Falsarthrobacter nasiphocae]MDR6891909.1 putative GNAT family acetyltransferase [Falsarthrobacter nasiphocae]
MTYTFTHTEQDGQHVIEAHEPEGSVAGEIVFSESGGVFPITHTGVRPQFRGKGLAADLADRAFAEIEHRGGRVIPTCPYIQDTYLPRHPELKRLVVGSEGA